MLTKHSRRIRNARHFWSASTLVFTAQYFKCSGLRCSPLNAALAFKERNLHIPGKFKQENIEELVGLIREYPFATIVTLSESGINANHLPLCLMELGGELYLKG
ncbi:FMN-binding negative transcriptional regulator, partial [Vibrio cholerae]|uniref:FMN-binding negative transcriptional regulator n=1 Tax=Vibrio cholerae TaxID=666 RepID=UPI0028A5CA4E